MQNLGSFQLIVCRLSVRKFAQQSRRIAHPFTTAPGRTDDAGLPHFHIGLNRTEELAQQLQEG